MNKNNLITILTILVLLLTGVVFWLFSRGEEKQENIKIQEVTEVDEKKSWKVFNDEEKSIEFKYPAELEVKYMSAQFWPPKVTLSSEGHQMTCPETDPSNSSVYRISRKVIDGREYCIRANSEGVAGSVYTEYSYSTSMDNKLVTLNFTLQYPSCLNYDEGEKSACQVERENFDLDALVNNIVDTLRLN